RSYLKDAWDVPGYRMTVDYKEEGSAMDSIICQLRIKPWPEAGRLQPNLRVADWLALFGQPATADVLRKKLQPLNLVERLKETEDPREVVFILECGLQLYFAESKGIKLIKRPAPVKSTDLVLAAVSFFRARELDARQWTGELPFRLSFDDSQPTMLTKVGPPPDKQKDDKFSGFALWDLPEFSLK